jgi:hypothetical protein
MSDEKAALSAAEDYIAYLSQYRHGDDGPTEPAILANAPAARKLFDAESGWSPEVRGVVASRLSRAAVEVPDPLAAALLAYDVGSLVEVGADPVPLGEAIVKRLPTDFAAARRFVELLKAETGLAKPDDADRGILARLGRQERAGASAWAALRISTPAAMAVWCRHRPSRLAAKGVPSLVEDAVFLGELGGYCWFIGELLSAADGMQITVIAPEQRKGFVVELEVVRNAAHLFALLEETLVGDPNQGLLQGPRTDATVAARLCKQLVYCPNNQNGTFIHRRVLLGF